MPTRYTKTKAQRRRSGYSFEEIHKVLFPDGPPKPKTIEELRHGIGQHIRKKFERR